MKSNFDCVIVGAGIAGMTAAIYLKRANVNVLLLEKEIPGGQINKTSDIANYPGFISIDGPTLAMKTFEQVNNLNIDYRYGNVSTIKMLDDEKIVVTDMEEIHTKSVILATGRHPRMLGLENEQKLMNHGISYCAICDGPLYKDKDVAVIGGGNSALEEALFLSSICHSVTIIHRGSSFRGDEIFQKRIEEKNNIKVYYHSHVIAFHEENGTLTSLTIQNDKGNENLCLDGVFIYIGADPDTAYLKEYPSILKDNYVIVDQNMRTTIPYFYACGDVIKKSVYQISTAVGEGAIAALSLIEDLK